MGEMERGIDDGESSVLIVIRGIDFITTSLMKEGGLTFQILVKSGVSNLKYWNRKSKNVNFKTGNIWGFGEFREEVKKHNSFSNNIIKTSFFRPVFAYIDRQQTTAS